MTRHLVTTTINSDEVEFTCHIGDTLLDVLRGELHLTGTKNGCGSGDCGACTVIVDGRPVNACLVLGVEAEGAQVETIEGMTQGTELHPLQKKFLDHASLQCGICTPGFLNMAKALLEERIDEGRPDSNRMTGQHDIARLRIQLRQKIERERIRGRLVEEPLRTPAAVIEETAVNRIAIGPKRVEIAGLAFGQHLDERAGRAARDDRVVGSGIDRAIETQMGERCDEVRFFGRKDLAVRSEHPTQEGRARTRRTDQEDELILHAAELLLEVGHGGQREAEPSIPEFPGRRIASSPFCALFAGSHRLALASG